MKSDVKIKHFVPAYLLPKSLFNLCYRLLYDKGDYPNPHALEQTLLKKNLDREFFVLLSCLYIQDKFDGNVRSNEKKKPSLMESVTGYNIPECKIYRSQM